MMPFASAYNIQLTDLRALYDTQLFLSVSRKDPQVERFL
jgi:hypothetical protein